MACSSPSCARSPSRSGERPRREAASRVARGRPSRRLACSMLHREHEARKRRRPGRSDRRRDGGRAVDDDAVHPITSTDVNDYLRDATGGPFTAKDYRTWAATLAAAWLFSGQRWPATQRECKRCIARTVDAVARIDHGPSQAIVTLASRSRSDSSSRAARRAGRARRSARSCRAGGRDIRAGGTSGPRAAAR